MDVGSDDDCDDDDDETLSFETADQSYSSANSDSATDPAPVRKPAPRRAKAKAAASLDQQRQEEQVSQSLVEAYDRVPKRYNKKAGYKRTATAMKKMVARYNKRQKLEAMKNAKDFKALSIPFFTQLKKLVDENDNLRGGMALVGEFVTMRIVVSGLGGLVSKNNMPLGFKFHKDNTTLTWCPPAPLHLKDYQIEWHVWVEDALHFKIKKSTICNARFGLFAGRSFETDELLGLYCGVVSNKKVTDKTITNSDGQRFTAYDDSSWMGLHFINDPTLYDASEEARKKINVHVAKNLLTYASRPISVDEELFLNYNLESIN